MQNARSITRSLSRPFIEGSQGVTGGHAFMANMTLSAATAVRVHASGTIALQNNTAAAIAAARVHASGAITLQNTTLSAATAARVHAAGTVTLQNNTVASSVATARPLDAVTGAFAAYSTRKLRTAYAGSAIRVQRSSDNAQQDIGFTTAGDLDTTALTAFVGANSGYIAKFYDQSGSGNDLIPVVAANMLRIVNAGTIDTVANGKASPVGTATNQIYTATLGVAVSSAKCEIFQVYSSSNASTYLRFVNIAAATGTNWNTTAAFALDGGASNNIAEIVYNSTTYGSINITVGNLQRSYAGFTGTASTLTNGVNTANGAPSTSFVVGRIIAGHDGTNSANQVAGFAAEAIVTNTNQVDYTILFNNQKAYWGTPG